MTYLFGWLLFLTSTFLILLILVQRGRGGGLAGALGGPGGQSAFGAKAGDTFTWITVCVASFWGLLCIGTILYFNMQLNKLDASDKTAGKKATIGAGADETGKDKAGDKDKK